ISDALVAYNPREIPFSIPAELEVIGIVASHLCWHTFGAPSPIEFGSASDGFLQVSPGPLRFVFINELEPFLGAQATATVEEIGRRHSAQRSVIFFVDSQRELTPETSPRSFSCRNGSCRSLRKGRQSDEQQQERCKKLRISSYRR